MVDANLKLKYKTLVSNWNSSKETMNARMNNFKINFAYNSGRIENKEITYHDTHALFETGNVIGFTGSFLTLLEQMNQKEALNFINTELTKETPKKIDIDFIKELQYILTKGTYSEEKRQKGEVEGTFKKGHYVVGRNDVGTLPESVEGELEFVLNEIHSINTSDSFSTLKIATYLHAWFEYIHPFADGNGRTGRLLMNYYLMIHKCPPIIIYNEDKVAYYEALEEFCETEDLDRLTEFFIYQALKTWKIQDKKPKGLQEMDLL